MNSPRGRLLGIDCGEKVIGIAVSDALPMLARPLQRLNRSTRERDFGVVRSLIAAHQIVGIVAGLPETPQDFDGKSQADTVRRWAIRLAGQVKIPVYLWEETYSTLEAEQISIAFGLKRQSRIDDRAAAVILQAFIDAHPPGTFYPEPLRGR